MKAFDHDLISLTVLDVSGCIESRASPWDSAATTTSIFSATTSTSPLERQRRRQQLLERIIQSKVLEDPRSRLGADHAVEAVALCTGGQHVVFRVEAGGEGDKLRA